eukprot:364062-Chlamydomonas_euryale.AAC.2
MSPPAPCSRQQAGASGPPVLLPGKPVQFAPARTVRAAQGGCGQRKADAGCKLPLRYIALGALGVDLSPRSPSTALEARPPSARAKPSAGERPFSALAEPSAES